MLFRSLCITKLDVLDEFESIKVCIGYKVDDMEIPFKSRLLHKAEPIYKEFAGWKKSLNACTNYDSLPAETLSFLSFIEEFVGVNISVVSNGPNRDDLIHR